MIEDVWPADEQRVDAVDGVDGVDGVVRGGAGWCGTITLKLLAEV